MIARLGVHLLTHIHGLICHLLRVGALRCRVPSRVLRLRSAASVTPMAQLGGVLRRLPHDSALHLPTLLHLGRLRTHLGHRPRHPSILMDRHLLLLRRLQRALTLRKGSASGGMRPQAGNNLRTLGLLLHLDHLAPLDRLRLLLRGVINLMLVRALAHLLFLI